MNKTTSATKIVFSVMSVFLFAGVFAAESAAGECDQLVVELSQIKSLIKRKSFLDEAVKVCGDDYLITYYYAYNFERRRKYDRALYFYKSAITLNPDHARSYFGLGDTYLALQKNKEAVAVFEKGLHLDPGNTWALKSLKKARERLPMQMEDQFAPVLREVPAFVKQTGSKPGEEKDITARDFIEHMRVDSGIEVDPQMGVLQMQIQFNPSSGELTPQAKEQLDSVVCVALQSNELKKDFFEVAGHTDASGSFELNMHISRMRAHAVKQYLIDSCGVVPDRLSVVYYGETRPMVPNISRKNRRLNRRVEFRRIIGKEKIMHRHKCPSEMTVVAGSVLGISSGGLAEDYLPEQ